MTTETDIDDFIEEECLCQMKVVPEDKRIDVLEIREGRNGKLKWTPVLRFHKDCPYHGIKEVLCQED